MSIITERAKEAKRELKKALPTVKFSVTTGKGQMSIGVINNDHAYMTHSETDWNGYVSIVTDSKLSALERQEVRGVMLKYPCNWTFKCKR